jgi:DNA (cytosine-5)-methyltransferase 1
MPKNKHRFYEFFAGGGMARAGLGQNWVCDFANDFDPMKADTYVKNWGAEDFLLADVAKISSTQIPNSADLVWASFPCQDLSLAGNYKGLGAACNLSQTRSGTFWPFWSLILQLKKEKRAPRLIVLENVVGTLTSRQGSDFVAICQALTDAGYRTGALLLDAKHFVPQSRPRIFFIAIASTEQPLTQQTTLCPDPRWHPPSLIRAHGQLGKSIKDRWLWWTAADPVVRTIKFADLIEKEPTGVKWHSEQETTKLLSMMAPLHLQKLAAAKSWGIELVGGVYKRTRPSLDGVKCQRAEVRFDDVAGCLRTPGGGSSRQTILVVKGESVRSRLLSAREAARLMGLTDKYILPSRYNDAYQVAGDGVCVPAVRFLAEQFLEPILNSRCVRPSLIAAE